MIWHHEMKGNVKYKVFDLFNKEQVKLYEYHGLLEQ